MSCSSTLSVAFISASDIWRDGLPTTVVLDELNEGVVLDELIGVVLDELIGVVDTIGSSTVKISNLFLTLVTNFGGKSAIVMIRGRGRRGVFSG